MAGGSFCLGVVGASSAFVGLGTGEGVDFGAAEAATRARSISLI